MALSVSPDEIVRKGEYQLLTKAPHWERVRLGDVAEVQNGFPFKSERFDRERGVPLIRIRDVNSTTTEHRFTGKYDPAFLVRRGEIIVGMDGDFKAARWQGGEALLNQRVCRLTLHSDVIAPGYFFLCLQPYLDAINAETSSVTVKHLSSRSVEDIPLPLPPLPEQHRIFAKIEELFSELDASAESLTRARAQLQTYRQALLKAAFEGKLTANWRAVRTAWRGIRLGEEITYLTSGSRGWADYYADQGDIFIRAQNLKFDRLDMSDVAYVRLPSGNSEGVRTRVRVGDVLITITGANVTKTGIVSRDIGTAFVSQHVALCRPGPNLRSEFLYWYLLAETGGRRQLNDAAYGAGKPGLNLENIREVTLRLPPIEEQDVVVSRINDFMSVEENVRETLECELKRITALRQSILIKAFSGQLVAQNPADESAASLVARLREQAPAPKTRRKKSA